MHLLNLRGVACALILLTIWNCKTNEVVPANNTLTFYYYPKTNVYYDVTNASYLYSIDSGKNWTVLLDSSRKNTKILGNKIIINSANSDIWKENELHRKMYGGRLINLVNHDSVKNKNVIVKPKSLLKKKKMVIPTDSVIIKEEKPKKRNFFQRLFGKKKKKVDTVENDIN